MLKRSFAFVGIILILFVNVYLALAQPISLECLVRKYDGPGGRKAGDIVTVQVLPHKGWGSEEGPPNYVIVKVTDIGLGAFVQYKGRHVPIDDKDPNSLKVRSKYRYDLTTLSGYSELSANVEVQFYQAAANLIDRRTE